jgi:hypothetical protein
MTPTDDAEELPQLQVRTGAQVWAVLVPPAFLRPETVAELARKFGNDEVLVRYQDNIIFLVSLASSDEGDDTPFCKLSAVALKIHVWLGEHGLVAYPKEPAYAALDFGHLPADANAWEWRPI